jgi:hypothetical protein
MDESNKQLVGEVLAPIAPAPGHAQRRVEEVGHDSPHRHKLPPPLFGMVVARAGLPAGETFASNTSVWLDLDLDSQRAARASQPNAGVNESNKALNQVQDGLNFQLSGWLFFHTRFNLESVKCPTTRSLLQVVPPLGRYAKPPAHDSELKEAERRLSSPSSRRSAVEVYWSLSLFLPTVCLTQAFFCSIR